MQSNKKQPSRIQPSTLDRFKLSYEYDKTISELKRDIKRRTNSVVV
jgi:hypothetical protein